MASVFEQFAADQRLTGPKPRPSDNGRFYYETADQLLQRISYEDLQWYVGQVQGGATSSRNWRAMNGFAQKYGLPGAAWMPLDAGGPAFNDYLVPYLNTWTNYRNAEAQRQQEAARAAEAARKAEAARVEQLGQEQTRMQGASRQRGGGDARQPTILTGPSGAGAVDVLIKQLLGGSGSDAQQGMSDMRRLLGG